jgi:hypothetical protein
MRCCSSRLHFRRARELQQRMKAVTVWDPGHAAAASPSGT